MYKSTSAILAMFVLAMTSCQTKEQVSPVRTGEVEFTVTAGIAGDITTYAPVEAFSHQGGAVNVDPSEYDLRYILEVYTKDAEPVRVYRKAVIVPDNFTTTDVTISTRLVAKKYDFVFWADFVKEGSTDDLYYNTDPLTTISYTDGVGIETLAMDEVDAYCHVEEVDLSRNQNIQGITLLRPFGKIRLIATDKLTDGVDQAEYPAEANVDFGNVEVPASFNALTGLALDKNISLGAHTGKTVNEDALVAGKDYPDAWMLGYYYIFASDGNTSYAMDVTCYDQNGNEIGVRNLSQIPVQKNKLTTVIGNFYTSEGTMEIIVEDPFEEPETEVNSEEVQDMMDALAKGEIFTLSCDIDITAAGGVMIPAGVSSTLDLNGHTVKASNGASGNFAVYGNLTISDSRGDGKIVAENDYTSNQYNTGVVTVVGDDATLTMDGGYIYAVRDNAVDNGQFGIVLDKGGNFTMTGGKVEAGWYAVSGNGTNSTQSSIIDIRGGELISTSDYAIYLPHSGTTYISGGTVNGAAGAVSIRRGELNISDDAVILSNGEGNTGEWGDGTGNQSNCGIMVDPAYGKCIVNIDGGTMSTAKDVIIFNSAARYASESTVSVSAGTFSDPTPLAYLDKAAQVKVALEKDYSGPGLGIFKNGNGDSASVEIDLGGKQWVLGDEPLFGSTGTVSQYFHLEKDATVTFKNGTLVTENRGSGKMLFQNYCILTLDRVTVLGGTACEYVISNNNGECNIINSTVTAAEDCCAFDVYSFASYEGVEVTVSGESVINGRVEFGGNNNRQNGKLIINGGTFNGDLVVTPEYYNSENPNITISGGIFNGDGWEDYK